MRNTLIKWFQPVRPKIDKSKAITVDVSRRQFHRIQAVRIWQELFRIYRNDGCDLDKMEHLALDLLYLYEFVQKSVGTIVYWNGDKFGTTEILDYYHWDCWKIEITSDSFIIKYINGQKGQS